jgi:hypothetical protein
VGLDDARQMGQDEAGALAAARRRSVELLEDPVLL